MSPLADQLCGRSLMSASEYPGELRRIGEDRVGGQHEALARSAGTSGLGAVFALWYVFKNRSVVMIRSVRQSCRRLVD
jgi:hypothetical protein